MRAVLPALALALLVAAPARADVPQGNLIVNPGADAAAGATDSSTVVPLPGWTTEGGLTAVQYGTPSFPTLEDSAKLGGGANFFAGGPGTPASTASQTIDVSRAAAEIDAGSVKATLTGMVGGWSTQQDAATITATSLSATGAPLATLTLDPATVDERGGLTTLFERTRTGTVPAGTRSFAVRIATTRTAGDYDDGYADNLSLTLAGAPEPGKTVGVTPTGTVLVELPGATQFVPLAQGTVPYGATIDTRKGRVEITARKGEKATFYDGIFKLTSERGGITNLTLTEPLACPKRGRAAATAAAVKTRHLWGSGKGHFRTTGRLSSATVRGTTWLVQDTCTTTLTRVTQGAVTVRDFALKRSVVVRAGKRYVARNR
jgi:hypothetical protein